MQHQNAPVLFVHSLDQFLVHHMFQHTIAVLPVRNLAKCHLPAAFFQKIFRLVNQQPDQPCAEIFWLSQVPDLLKCGKDGILYDVRCILLVFHITDRHFIQTLPIPLDQLYKGIGISVLCPFYKPSQISHLPFDSYIRRKKQEKCFKKINIFR